MRATHGMARSGKKILIKGSQRESARAREGAAFQTAKHRGFRWDYLEKRARKNDNGGSAVSSHNILALAELNKHLRGGMAGLQMLHDRGAVVGNEHLSRVREVELELKYF